MEVMDTTNYLTLNDLLSSWIKLLSDVLQWRNMKIRICGLSCRKTYKLGTLHICCLFLICSCIFLYYCPFHIYIVHSIFIHLFMSTVWFIYV